uniref:Uncharacterized protein n=1 Tax=Oryza glumipatula TaxID=40148 RepID=A0A0E0AUK3_9ORYZ
MASSSSPPVLLSPLPPPDAVEGSGSGRGRRRDATVATDLAVVRRAAGGSDGGEARQPSPARIRLRRIQWWGCAAAADQVVKRHGSSGFNSPSRISTVKGAGGPGHP